MTRQQLIELTKVKLEEISPFDEPQSFIIANGDNDYDKVKPIISYIDNTLDKATVFCLTNLPATLLSPDIAAQTEDAHIDDIGVAHVKPRINGSINYPKLHYHRIVRVSNNLWKKDCTTFISTADPLYLLQQNPYTRAGIAKPLVVINPETGYLDLFSFPKSSQNTTTSVTLWLIPLFYYNNTNDCCERPAESILSPIQDYIALACAAMVADIMGNTQQVSILRQQYNTQLESILH